MHFNSLQKVNFLLSATGLEISFEIRALITLITFLCFLYFVRFIYIALRDRSAKQKLLIRKIGKELFVPIIILIVFWGIETYWAYIIASTSFNIIHLLYEMFLILITFFALISYRIQEEYIGENANYYYLAKSLAKNLGPAKEKIMALSVDDFNNFFEELGLWYFLEQVRIIKDIRLKYSTLITKRIIAIQDDIHENELLRKAFGTEVNLTSSEKNLKNIDLLHSIVGIELYLVPKDKLMSIICDEALTEGQKGLKNKKLNNLKNETYRNYDRVVIDDKCFYPREVKNKFKFSEDEDKESRKFEIITERIFKVLADNTDSIYYVDKIKDLYPK